MRGGPTDAASAVAAALAFRPAAGDPSKSVAATAIASAHPPANASNAAVAAADAAAAKSPASLSAADAAAAACATRWVRRRPVLRTKAREMWRLGQL